MMGYGAVEQQQMAPTHAHADEYYDEEDEEEYGEQEAGEDAQMPCNLPNAKQEMLIQEEENQERQQEHQYVDFYQGG